MDQKTRKALSYWQVAIQYLDLSENVSRLIAEGGNHWGYIQSGIDFERQIERHRAATKWTDYNQGIPVIFNFYHGLELLLKGFMCVVGDVGGKHELSTLLNKVKVQHPNGDFVPLIEKYVNESMLPTAIRDFLNETSISIDEWYQAFKYPESTKGNVYAHNKLQFQAEKGASFYGELACDIHSIRVSSVKYARDRYDGLV